MALFSSGTSASDTDYRGMKSIFLGFFLLFQLAAGDSCQKKKVGE